MCRLIVHAIADESFPQNLKSMYGEEGVSVSLVSEEKDEEGYLTYEVSGLRPEEVMKVPGVRFAPSILALSMEEVRRTMRRRP